MVDYRVAGRAGAATEGVWLGGMRSWASVSWACGQPGWARFWPGEEGAPHGPPAGLGLSTAVLPWLASWGLGWSGEQACRRACGLGSKVVTAKAGVVGVCGIPWHGNNSAPTPRAAKYPLLSRWSRSEILALHHH